MKRHTIWARKLLSSRSSGSSNIFGSTSLSSGQAVSLLPVQTSYGIFSSAAAAWAPPNLGVALKAWWSADDHGTANMIDDGAGLISSWTDRIGANQLTGVTTARPTWTSNSVNGAYAGLTFDGVANVLVKTGTGTLPTGAVAGEIAASYQQTALAADTVAKFIFAYGGPGSTARGVYRASITGSNRASTTDGAVFNNDTAIDMSGAGVILGNWSGTTQSGRVNGNIFNPSTGVIPALATAGTRMRIGSNALGTASQFCNFPIRHVLVMTALAVADRERLEAWLAWDIGAQSILPPAHPYKSVRP